MGLVPVPNAFSALLKLVELFFSLGTIDFLRCRDEIAKYG